MLYSIMKDQIYDSLHCIIYMSSASKSMDSDELSSILEQSRKKNISYNVTGMLVYSLGNIIQVLEGNSQIVQGLYATISKDVRHFGIVKLMDKPVESRSFGEWSMGFRTMSEDRLTDLKNICQASLLSEDAQTDSTLSSIKSFVIRNT